MEQKGISGRDTTQVGRDFIQKIFDLSVLNQNVSYVNILNPDDSEIRAYLSYWEKLDSAHKIELVLNCRNSIKENYKISSTKYESDNSSLRRLILVLFICLFLPIQYKPYREILQQKEYIAFNWAASTYCGITKDMLIPLPGCTAITKVKDTSQLKTSLKKDFESYKNSWSEIAVSSIIIPVILSALISRILEYPSRVLKESKAEKEKDKLRQENKLVEAEKRAKEQTYNVLFHLLSKSEQSQLVHLEMVLKIKEIKTLRLSRFISFIAPVLYKDVSCDEPLKVEGVDNLLQHFATIRDIVNFAKPQCLRTSNLENAVVYISILFPYLDENSKEKFIACLFPQVERKLIIAILEAFIEINSSKQQSLLHQSNDD